MQKELLAAFAIALTLVAFWPYIRSIHQNKTKPHIFSWILWGSTTFIVFLAQYADKGGAGAWPIGISGLITLYVAFLAYQKKSDITITGSDRIFFSLGLLSLPVWYFTNDPLWAVIILTAVDLAGFAPTFRKAYFSPKEEPITFYLLMTLRNFIVLTALENYTLTTTLFPALVGLAALILVIMIILRRKIIALAS